MKTNVEAVMPKAGAILALVSTLAISVALSAPAAQQQQQPAQPVASSPQAKPAASPASSKAQPGALQSAASVSSGAPSLVSLKALDLDTFDGKNPFADDSLWQIPVHLVRDLSAAETPGAQKLASAASSASSVASAEAASLDEDNDDEQPALSTGRLQLSSSSAPTVISASTDLKTAAGYHYPTHGHAHSHYGGHHEPAHHGGHHYGGSHGADHHYGKYFQYASVPYPHAWEFGYRRGNPYHTIERYEHGKGPHFQTKVKWSDKHGGYGVHVWDYNHDDHHAHHYGAHHDNHHDSYTEPHHGPHHAPHHGYPQHP